MSLETGAKRPPSARRVADGSPGQRPFSFGKARRSLGYLHGAVMAQLQIAAGSRGLKNHGLQLEFFGMLIEQRRTMPTLW
jgi:hypothetical protein